MVSQTRNGGKNEIILTNAKCLSSKYTELNRLSKIQKIKFLDNTMNQT